MFYHFFMLAHCLYCLLGPICNAEAEPIQWKRFKELPDVDIFELADSYIQQACSHFRINPSVEIVVDDLRRPTRNTLKQAAAEKERLESKGVKEEKMKLLLDYYQKNLPDMEENIISCWDKKDWDKKEEKIKWSEGKIFEHSPIIKTIFK